MTKYISFKLYECEDLCEPILKKHLVNININIKDIISKNIDDEFLVDNTKLCEFVTEIDKLKITVCDNCIHTNLVTVFSTLPHLSNVTTFITNDITNLVGMWSPLSFMCDKLPFLTSIIVNSSVNAIQITELLSFFSKLNTINCLMNTYNYNGCDVSCLVKQLAIYDKLRTIIIRHTLPQDKFINLFCKDIPENKQWKFSTINKYSVMLSYCQ